MKKLIALLLFSILLLAGCSPEEPIKVAFVGGISGNLSELGVQSRNAFLLKVKEVNEAGGINGRLIETFIFDDQNDPSKIPGIYDQLRESNINYVVGHILSSLAIPVLEEAAKKDILIVSATMSTNVIDNYDDYLIRSAVSNSFQALRMAKKMNDDKRENIIVVVDMRNQTYTKEFETVFTNNFNGHVTAISFDPNKDDDQAIYDAIEDENPDAMLLITPAIDTAFIAQKSKKNHENLHLYGVSWSMSVDLINNGGDAVEGMRIVYTKSSEDYEDIKSAYRERYKAEYNEEGIFVSDIVYEASKCLFESMVATKNVTPEEVKEVLISTKFEGIEDSIDFNEFGDRKGDYSIFVVENGEFILLE